MSLNFARFTLDTPLNDGDTQFFITTARKYKRGQPSGGNDQFYDLTQQLAGGILQNMTATFENTSGELYVERIRAGLVEANGTTDDGRNKYKVTIAISSDAVTQLRGLKNDEDDTNNVLNVDTDNITSQFPAKSRVKLAWAANDIQRIVDLFTANSTVTIAANAGENIAIRRSVSKSAAEWFKFTSGKTSFAGISTEVMTSAVSYSIATFGALVTGFVGLTDNGSVFADYVLPGGALTDALAGSGAGNVDDGSHLYKVTYVVADVEGTYETDGGTVSGGVTVADKTVDGQVALTAIPTSANAAVTSRKIYRQFNAAGDYKLLTTIADNSTTTYTDNTANSGLTTVMPTANGATGLITQAASTTSYQIGRADGATAVRISDIAAFTSQFNQNAFSTFDNGDNSKTMSHDSSGQTTGTDTGLGSDAPINTLWKVPADTGAAEFFASKNYANSASAGSALNSIPIGTAFSAGEAAYIDKPSAFDKATNAISVGGTASNEKASFPIIGSGVSTSSGKFSLRKVSTPTDNLVIRIETDSAGVPSGTLVHANASESIAGAGLTTSFVDTVATFIGAFTPAANTQYHVVFERSGPNDAVEYFQVGFKSGNSYFQGSSYISAVWTPVATRHGYFSSFTGAVDRVATKTDANNSDQIQTYGFANVAGIAYASVGFDLIGITDTQSGLTIGEPYFLSDTPGAISLTAGTILKFAGTAVSATGLFISPIDQADILTKQYASLGGYSGAQEANGVDTVGISTTSDEHDADFLSGFDASISTDRITINRAGWYRFSSSLNWTSLIITSSGGPFPTGAVKLRKNGTTTLFSTSIPFANGSGLLTVVFEDQIVLLAAGDYIETTYNGGAQAGSQLGVTLTGGTFEVSLNLLT